MPAALVRKHTYGASTTSGSTIAATIVTANVTAGNLLVALVGSRPGVAVSSISKPGSETASWTKLEHVTPSGSRAELWVIKTTVSWPVATAVTATYASSTDRRAMLLVEYSGVDAVVRAAAGTGVGTGSQASAAAATGLQAGDLVLGAGVETADAWGDRIALDADTTAGSWAEADFSTLRTTFSDGQGLDVTLQHKILTTGSPQSFNVQGTTTPLGSPTVLTTDRAVGAVAVGLRNSNVAPNAPTLQRLIGGVVVNRGAVQRAQWVFSDPNPADVQSAFDLRFRLVGSPSWTTIHQDTFFTIYDFAAFTFAAGDYEWQVSTYDSIGVQGPYSSSEFFTAADPPDGPAITYPTDGQSLDHDEHVTWSAPDQDEYQVRRVADDAGDPDPSTIYYDTGEVAEPDTRTVPLTFATNNRTEHIQVRIKNDGLWSGWVSVSGDVSYTPPPTPTFQIFPDAATGSILVAIVNPAPAGDDPGATYNDLYVDDGAGEERRATQLAPNATWRYWTPVSGRDYVAAVRIVAVAANGTTSSSGA